MSSMAAIKIWDEDGDREYESRANRANGDSNLAETQINMNPRLNSKCKPSQKFALPSARLETLNHHKTQMLIEDLI
ncbi:hypothetical protein L6452_32844 [Arctium lappa]|uniref:Uncharacterized protein n=1 Tax=Arctium lappa TaxID=4217 RepID=A0ACB8Z5G5_ARCLA|nr:hypothetical protein L6452_32844 [Arctium lappa]